MATGRGEQNGVTILWRIQNISSFEKGFHNATIFSPITQSDHLGKISVFLRMGDESEGDMRLCFHIIGSHGKCNLDYEFSLLTWDGSPLVSETVRNRISSCIDMPNCPTTEEVFVTRKSSFLCGDTLTVRCRVWKSVGKLLPPEFMSVGSRIDVSQDSFMWPIAGFSEFKHLRSITPVVLTGFSHGSQVLKCHCSFVGEGLPDSKLDIRVTVDTVVQTFSLKLEASVLGDEQEKIKLLETGHIFPASEKEQTWMLPEDELNEELQTVLFKLSCEDSLNLLFHFKAVSKSISKFIETPVQILNSVLSNTRTVSTVSEMGCQTSQLDDYISDNLKPEFSSLSILGEDLRSMYCEHTKSDFTLRSGEASFPVHKNILSARSPVFRSMFSSNMKESCSSSSDIPDLDSRTLNRMLTFLYTSNIERDLDFEGAAKLYYAADKYQVDDLKSRCSSILRSGTSVSNVSDILALAHKHEDPELESFAHEFILIRYEEVMHSDAWEAFLDGDPCLAGKTAHQLYKEKKARKKLMKATE